MHILVTGSKGLIGTALKEALKERDFNVSGLDIHFPSGHPEHGDILDTKGLSSFVDQADGIVHLAAVARVIEGLQNPSLCWRTNVQGTSNIVELALASKKKPWVLFASSREIYGEQSHFPVLESAQLRPINIYGKSKREAERMIQAAQERGLQTAILRFSNVYGSIHDHQDRVIPAFCRTAAFGGEIKVAGKDFLFDFVHLDDAVQGVLLLISLLIKTRASFPPIQLTRGIATSLMELAKIAQKKSFYPLGIIDEPPQDYRISRFWGDPALAQRILGWKSRISVEEGMDRLIEEYRAFHKCAALASISTIERA